ncbi:hypothetical protein EWM64_g2135 [Hericium alpestre]|uniref:Mediator of RNA polymerase II transcription subunit 19 n=1 Tax=Hericium alpestre TaxID=135208 RepID=A0A4Z0A8G3_9AGAM|nr:hypothetical protein EWM64_g2135 [Hericium alpestre]
MFPEPGPSSASSPPPPVTPSSNLFLLPSAPPRPLPLLTSTQDLVTRFNLRPAYDKFVRPLAAPPPASPTSPLAPQTPITPFPPPDKGKGKERESGTPPPDGDDEDGKDGKKKKNSYKHLIKGIPGRHSMKKDDFLTTAISVPPKQHIPITPFDLRTQREAFSVSLEGLKGWNIHALVLESTQAREDRKKRHAAAGPTANNAAARYSAARREARIRGDRPGAWHAEYDGAYAHECERDGAGRSKAGDTGREAEAGEETAHGEFICSGMNELAPNMWDQSADYEVQDMQGQARDMHLPMQQPTPQGI